MVMSGKESTNRTVKSGKLSTSCHSPQALGKALTNRTSKSANASFFWTLISAKPVTTCTRPKSLMPSYVQSSPIFRAKTCMGNKRQNKSDAAFILIKPVFCPIFCPVFCKLFSVCRHPFHINTAFAVNFIFLHIPAQ